MLLSIHGYAIIDHRAAHPATAAEQPCIPRHVPLLLQRPV